jgi:endonuclease/exonuclease/phosphatase (EEP) superfamily protein YafD
MPAPRGPGNPRRAAFRRRRSSRAGAPGIVRAVRFRPTNLILLLALPAFAAAGAPFAARWHWSLDLLACFVVQAMAALALAGTALLAARRWWVALACFAGAGLAAVAVAPAWCGDPGRVAGAGSGAALRVLSLNLLRGNEAAVDRALAAIAASAPDVVFCSEVTPAWLAAVEPRLTAFPHRCHRTDAGWFGVALFAKVPLRSAEVIPLAYDWAPAVRAVLDTPAGPIGVLGVHTPRPAALAPLPQPWLVLGDCNATPWNPAFADLCAAAGLHDAGGTSFAPTWPSSLPWPLRIPIDHVLTGRGLVATEVVVGGDFGSDHLPVAAVLVQVGANGR